MAQPASKRVLIIDDDPSVSALLRRLFERLGYRIESASQQQSAEQLLKRYSFDAILLDLMLGPEQGLDMLPFLLREAPFARVFILSACGTVPDAVHAMVKGAAGFFTKDENPETIVQNVVAQLHEPFVFAEAATDPDFGIVGRSPAIKQLKNTIQRLGEVDSTVLIFGESGTGKELVARALHQCSPRRKERFEAINCGAIPENLLESELFGHKRGAFTDAKNDRKGIFEICSQGTLFLDEIGEMPPNLQTKLLRVLQEWEVMPVGSSQPIKINTRVIAATNRNLAEEVKTGRFREDLFFRLSVIPIYIPSLRERGEDLCLLIDYFLRKFNQRFGRHISFPVAETLARLRAYSWPGNVRELQNAIERGVVLGQDDQLRVEHVFLQQQFALKSRHSEAMHEVAEELTDWFAMPLGEAKQRFEKAYLEHLIKSTSGNITEVARLAGRYRADIYRLLAKYQIESRANH